MDVNVKAKRTYSLEFNDEEMQSLWGVFDLARDTIMRLPNGTEASFLVGFMDEIESETGRHRKIDN